ncbi:Mce protein [Mycobacterium koreense]|uniref:Mce protein n=1 Tax=Mycolicibacillus koreensis TaxID=1069220 RepID=UPI000D6A7C10|nr:Mce protein [Mycolicibacillus koreensis]MCV7248703.1 Mce protein [Mycolicibacillus koreensis]BBY55666.1 hypothetical protein MKOR_29170 [Mycolicibacillus koreensis]
MSTAEPRAEKATEASEDTVAGVEVTETSATETSGATESTESTGSTGSAETSEVDPSAWAASSGGGPKRWLRLGGAALLAVLLIVSAVEGGFLYQHHRVEVAKTDAVAAAKDFTMKLATIDPDAVDQNQADVLDGSTGRFRDMYSETMEDLRTVLVENEAAAHGRVVEAAVKSASAHKVEVMLFVDQSVRNKELPQPQMDRSRIVLVMEKIDGRWLASDIEHP